MFLWGADGSLYWVYFSWQFLEAGFTVYTLNTNQYLEKKVCEENPYKDK